MQRSVWHPYLQVGYQPTDQPEAHLRLLPRPPELVIRPARGYRRPLVTKRDQACARHARRNADTMPTAPVGTDTSICAGSIGLPTTSPALG